MFILSTKTNGKTLIYQKPSARGFFFAIGLLLLLKIYSNLKSFKRENHNLPRNGN